MLSTALEEEDGGTTATMNERVGQGAIIISGSMSGGAMRLIASFIIWSSLPLPLDEVSLRSHWK
jgi:hypothetical protein